MKLFSHIILAMVFMLCITGGLATHAKEQPRQKISAFMRVKNEILTVGATLGSIDGLFDRIVIKN